MDELPKSKGARGKKEDDERPAEPEARAIDVKVKGAEDGGAMLQGNLDLLKKMQEEQWKNFEWVDAEVSICPHGHRFPPLRRQIWSNANIFSDRGLMVHL